MAEEEPVPRAAVISAGAAAKPSTNATMDELMRRLLGGG